MDLEQMKKRETWGNPNIKEYLKDYFLEAKRRLKFSNKAYETILRLNEELLREEYPLTTPLVYCASLIYTGLLLSAEERTTNEIAHLFGIRENSVRNSYKKLERKLCKDYSDKINKRIWEIRGYQQQVFFGIIKQILMVIACKEAQVQENNLIFKKELFNTSMELSKKVNNTTLKNMDIREKIKEVSAKSDVSVGEAQKMINTYLKYYCILTRRSISIIKELDCPLNNRIMSEFKTDNLKGVSLKEMNFNDYVSWQKHLKNLGEGYRLKQDIEIYDREKIKSFLS